MSNSVKKLACLKKVGMNTIGWLFLNYQIKLSIFDDGRLVAD